VSDQATDPRPPWRDLFDEAALRRLARLAALRGGEQLVWLGEGSEKQVKQLEKISEDRVKVRADLDGIPKRSLGLVVAPEIVEQIGLEKALKELRSALETDGVVALVVRAAIGDEVPEKERAHWEQRQHGPLETVMQVMGQFSAVGFETLTVEMLPHLPGVGLGLFIGRRVEPGAPPRWPRRAGME
jgi:hypothetical protein